MDQSFFGYAVPGLMTSFGFSLTSIGLLISAGFLFSIVVATLAGSLTDLYGAKWTLPICLGLSALLVGLQGLATVGGVFAGLRVFGYGFSGALSPITNAMVSTAMPARHRPLAIAILQCGYPLGWFAASLIAAPILPIWGWRGIFLAAFAVLPAAVLFVFLIPNKARVENKDASAAPAPKASLAAPIAMLFSKPYRHLTIQVAIAFLLYGGAAGGTTFYLPSFFEQARGYSASAAAHIVGLSYGVGVVGYVGSALVSQHLLSRRNTVALWLGLGAVAFATLIWTHFGPAADVILFGLTAVFLFGASAILIVYLLELFPDHLRATAAAIAGTSAIGLGFVIFPVLTAALQGRLGWSLTFSCTALPAVALSAILMFTLPRRPTAA
jgi:MFS family permease